MIGYDIQDSKFGKTLLATTQKGVCAILFATDNEHDLVKELSEMFPEETLDHGTVRSMNAIDRFIDALEADLDFDKLTVNIMSGTPFQRSVWQALQKIPRGTTISYSELAERIGRPKAVRAVASACGENPISVLIPCHRIVPKVGGIGKYRWGTHMKQILLDREKIKVTNG